ncbi:MAG: SAM-dependent methyltransferase [Candidatus Woesearchaeota archaeon]|nr:SAM-dependent methyltransferase [Candidatus Woesearchaeota archaeon]
MRSDSLGPPQSLLDAMVGENQRYYQIFALLCEPTGKLFDPARLLAFEAGLEERFLVGALRKGYASIIAGDIIKHFERHLASSYDSGYDLLEFGSAEGALLSHVLDIIEVQSPGLYDRINVHSVDFSVYYAEHQEANLSRHLGKVRFIRENAIVADLPKIDYFIMNEVLDDLPATTINFFRDEWNILAYQERFHSSGRQCDLNYFPVSTQGLEMDYSRVLAYLQEYGYKDIASQMNVYVGVSDLFKLIGSRANDNARCFVMDYMYDVPGEMGWGGPVSTEDNISARADGEMMQATNIHCQLEYPQIARIVAHHGFDVDSAFNLDEFGERPYHRYFAMFLEK